MSRKTLTTCGVAAALVLALGSGGTTAFAAPGDPTTPDLTAVAVSADKKNLELTGERLTGASLVLVGDTVIKVDKKVATNVTATKVIVKAPTSLKGGSYHVAVVTPNGVDAVADGYGALPVVSKVVAFEQNALKKDVAVAGDSDKGGLHVRVIGTGFTGATSVSFGKAAVTGDALKVLSDTVADVTVPAKAAADAYLATSPNTGKFPVTAVNTHGTGTKGFAFIYKALPTVTAASAKGSKFDAKDVKVTFTGTNLLGTVVTFGTKKGVVQAGSTATSLVVLVPTGATGSSVDVVVKNAAGSTKLADKWAYSATAPTAPVEPTPTEPVVTDPAPVTP